MPPADAGTLVVWRLGEATLAVPLSAVEEVAPVGGDGRAKVRDGSLEVVAPPGLDAPGTAALAVVVGWRGEEGVERMALGAEEVEGVVPPGRQVEARPAWLGGLAAPHLAGLVRLDEGRVAALLHVPALFPDP